MTGRGERISLVERSGEPMRAGTNSQLSLQTSAHAGLQCIKTTGYRWRNQAGTKAVRAMCAAVAPFGNVLLSLPNSG